MLTAIVILLGCIAPLATSVAFLLYKGRYGQRGIVWTARMGDDD